MERYHRDLKNIVDLYNIYNLKSDSGTSTEGKGLINKSLIVCLYYLLK